MEFIKTINNNGTPEEFKEALIYISALVGSYGDYNTQIVADDSMKAIAEVQKILYENTPFDVAEDKLDTVIPEIMEIIKTNMPMISLNSATTSAEMDYSFASYYNEYDFDIIFLDIRHIYFQYTLVFIKDTGQSQCMRCLILFKRSIAVRCKFCLGNCGSYVII